MGSGTAESAGDGHRQRSDRNTDGDGQHADEMVAIWNVVSAKTKMITFLKPFPSSFTAHLIMGPNYGYYRLTRNNKLENYICLFSNKKTDFLIIKLEPP